MQSLPKQTKKSMQSHQLAETFLSLGSQDTIFLTTIRANARNQALKPLNGHSYFFAYELLDTRALNRQYNTSTSSCYFEIVSAAPVPLPAEIFVSMCTLTIGELYARLSETSFRVEKETTFRRMSLGRPESLQKAVNPLTRLLYRQDVSCLSNLDAQMRFLRAAREKAHRLARSYNSRSCYFGDGDEQRALQAFLTGTYHYHVQIHLPPKEHELLMSIIARQQAKNMDVESSCDSESSEMMSEEEEFLMQLQIELKTKEGEDNDSDVEEKDRSREKRRRF